MVSYYRIRNIIVILLHLIDSNVLATKFILWDYATVGVKNVGNLVHPQVQIKHILLQVLWV